MARKRQVTTMERLAQVEEQITMKEEELKAIKAERKVLLEEKKKEDMEEIYRIFSESGKSIDELKEILSTH